MFILSLSILTSLTLTINLKHYFRNHDNIENHNNNIRNNNNIKFHYLHFIKKTRSLQDLIVCLPRMEAKRNLIDLWTVPKVYDEDCDKIDK